MTASPELTEDEIEALVDRISDRLFCLGAQLADVGLLSRSMGQPLQFGYFETAIDQAVDEIAGSELPPHAREFMKSVILRGWAARCQETALMVPAGAGGKA